MGRRTILLVLFIALVVLLSDWLLEQHREQAEEETEVAEKVADYFLADFTATTMDDQGHPHRRLSAERMTHYSDETSVMANPAMVLFNPDATQWHFTARRGWTEPGGEWIYLEEDVVFERPGDTGVVRLTTEWMRLHSNRQYAETDRPVTVVRPGSRIDAVGMRAYGDERRVVFLSQVRGVHEPATR